MDHWIDGVIASAQRIKNKGSTAPDLTADDTAELERLVADVLRISGEDQVAKNLKHLSPSILASTAGLDARNDIDFIRNSAADRNKALIAVLKECKADGLRLIKLVHENSLKVEEVIAEIMSIAEADMPTHTEIGLRQTLFIQGPVLALKHANALLEDCRKEFEPKRHQPTEEDMALIRAMPRDLLDALAESGVPFSVIDAQTGHEVSFAFTGAASPKSSPANNNPPKANKHKKGKGSGPHQNTAGKAPEQSAAPEAPSLTPEQVRAHQIETLLTKQREAMEAETAFRMSETEERAKRPKIEGDIKDMPELAIMAQEDLIAAAQEIPELKARQQELLAAINDSRAEPYVRTAESLVVQSALADSVPALAVAVPVVPQAAAVKTADLAEFEAIDDTGIQDVLAAVKAARGEAHKQEQSYLTVVAQNEALQRAVDVYDSFINRAEHAASVAQAHIKQLGTDNGRLLAQLVQVNPAHPILREFMTAVVVEEQPQALTV